MATVSMYSSMERPVPPNTRTRGEDRLRERERKNALGQGIPPPHLLLIQSTHQRVESLVVPQRNPGGLCCFCSAYCFPTAFSRNAGQDSCMSSQYSMFGESFGIPLTCIFACMHVLMECVNVVLLCLYASICCDGMYVVMEFMYAEMWCIHASML